MSDLKPLPPTKSITSTVSRVLPEGPVEPEPEKPSQVAFSTVLSNLQPFPAVPTPPGLADRP